MVKIGCCGFPIARPKYFEEFQVVEIQQTFYQPPRLETLQRWREQAPELFEFTLKAWQLITHLPTSPTYHRLKQPLPPSCRNAYGFFKPTQEVFTAWESTRQCARALHANKILFQCPASFQPTDENIHNMEQFFQTIDREGLTLCWEPRGNWMNKTIATLCEKLCLVHCVDPFVNKSVAGAIKYFRLHGIGGYRYRYTPPDFERLLQFCEGEELIYCLFNNVTMLEDARSFILLPN